MYDRDTLCTNKQFHHHHHIFSHVHTFCKPDIVLHIKRTLHQKEPQVPAHHSTHHVLQGLRRSCIISLLHVPFTGAESQIPFMPHNILSAFLCFSHQARQCMLFDGIIRIDIIDIIACSMCQCRVACCRYSSVPFVMQHPDHSDRISIPCCIASQHLQAVVRAAIVYKQKFQFPVSLSVQGFQAMMQVVAALYTGIITEIVTFSIFICCFPLSGSLPDRQPIRQAL